VSSSTVLTIRSTRTQLRRTNMWSLRFYHMLAQRSCAGYLSVKCRTMKPISITLHLLLLIIAALSIIGSLAALPWAIDRYEREYEDFYGVILWMAIGFIIGIHSIIHLTFIKIGRPRSNVRILSPLSFIVLIIGVFFLTVGIFEPYNQMPFILVGTLMCFCSIFGLNFYGTRRST